MATQLVKKCPLWNQKINPCIHKSPKLGPHIRQLNLGDNFKTYHSRIHFSIILPSVCP